MIRPRLRSASVILLPLVRFHDPDARYLSREFWQLRRHDGQGEVQVDIGVLVNHPMAGPAIRGHGMSGCCTVNSRGRRLAASRSPTGSGPPRRWSRHRPRTPSGPCRPQSTERWIRRLRSRISAIGRTRHWDTGVAGGCQLLRSLSDERRPAAGRGQFPGRRTGSLILRIRKSLSKRRLLFHPGSTGVGVP